MKNNKVLELINVSKTFSNKKAVENVSFYINKNDIFGFLGPNGAGKTTTIRLILNLLKLDSGNIFINGKPSDSKNIRRRIGICLENEGLYENLTCKENLEFYDRIYNSKINREERIKKLADKVGLIEINKKVFEFSKGMKKRLGIAIAMVNNPEIIILDEPLTGLDPEGQELIKEVLKKLSQESTIFFSSHNLNDVEDICNKIAIINTSIVKFGDTLELLNNVNKKLIIDLDKECTYKDLEVLDCIDNIQKSTINQNIITLEYKKDLEIGVIVSKLNNMGYRVLNTEKKLNTIKDIYFESLKKEENNG